MIKQKYTIIGLMSGTSLDGVDIALCHFQSNPLSAEISRAKTISYSVEWLDKLSSAKELQAEVFWKLHVDYGRYLGQLVRDFIKENSESIDAVASHGHTVFHQPHNGFTCQIGDGAAIAAESGITTICDFRSLDVALGGQGAPLVPIGDKLLFGDYAACLNIGGIANISFDKKGNRIAFDICAANMVLNELAKEIGKTYDDGGHMAVSGKVDSKLLKQFNELDFYAVKEKKSLGREWVEENILSVLAKSNISVPDKLATVAEHAAIQIASILNEEKIKNVLITGGGAYNTDLINRIKKHSATELIIPEKKIIEFKEALIFAFLGMKRMREENNSLNSVTGAKTDSVGGAIYFMK